MRTAIQFMRGHIVNPHYVCWCLPSIKRVEGGLIIMHRELDFTRIEP